MSKKIKTRQSISKLSADNFARQRALDAVADYFVRLQRRPFTISQLVSIARALRPYAEQEARRRQAHGTTAPGRRHKDKTNSGFDVRSFITRCVGLAPKTLRKAEAVVEAAERDPRLRNHLLSMDENNKAGPAFSLLGSWWSPPPLSKVYAQQAQPAGRQFGERLVSELIGQGKLPQVTEAFGARAKRGKRVLRSC